MTKAKKTYTPTSFRLDAEIYDRLVKYCEEAGQSKTTAVERAIAMYIDDYEAKKKLLERKTKSKQTK